MTAKVRSSVADKFRNVRHSGTARCRKVARVCMGSMIGLSALRKAVSGQSQTMPRAGGMALPICCQEVLSSGCRIQ